MESGALSDPKFAEFATSVIPYLHVTTRLEGHKYDGMLKEKGGRGFPTLMFLDHKGEILAQQRDRSVEGFKETRDKVLKIADLQARLAKGEKGLEKKLFFAELALGRVELDEAKARYAKFKDLSDKQKKVFATFLVDDEVQQLMGKMRGEGGEEAMKRMVEIWRSGNLPSKEHRGMMWSALLMYGESHSDAEVYTAAMKGMNELYGDDERFKSYYERLEKTLEKIQKANASAG